MPFYINLWPDDAQAPFFPPLENGVMIGGHFIRVCLTLWMNSWVHCSIVSVPADAGDPGF
ncbi:hypothetical protein [Pontiella sulfatireligans]|uniref:Uncharacterized protein n=1 Tax=Pontiella sulfatireligans TaxID=2750658 RepID=A0A6C2UVV3_9BACT|nr:hypothetical protein [Pontiella sulfatireligans]VGO23237.1 hypothetical protein SCARR_05344 [Pontiella sulfatireligans]